MKTKLSLTERRQNNATRKLEEYLDKNYPGLREKLSIGRWHYIDLDWQIDMLEEDNNTYTQYHAVVFFSKRSDSADDFSFEKNF